MVAFARIGVCSNLNVSRTWSPFGWDGISSACSDTYITPRVNMSPLDVHPIPKKGSPTLDNLRPLGLYEILRIIQAAIIKRAYQQWVSYGIFILISMLIGAAWEPVLQYCASSISLKAPLNLANHYYSLFYSASPIPTRYPVGYD